MKSLPVAISFSFIILNIRFPLNFAYRIHRSQLHEDEKHSSSHNNNEHSGSVDMPNLSSWTSSNTKHHQKVQVTTLDLNRAYTPYPIALPVSFTEHTRHYVSNATRQMKKEKCILNFCENVENYPEDLIKNVLKRSNNNLESYFKQAEVPFDLNNRGAFDDEDDIGDTMCPVKSITLYPRTAKNTKNEERILVNVEGARQGIVFETCLLENTKCKFSAGFPVGYVTACKQKYIRRSLAVLDGENQNTAWDAFEIPSCCVCVIKKEE